VREGAVLDLATSGRFGELFIKVASNVGPEDIVCKLFETGAVRIAIRRLLEPPSD